MYSTTDDLTQLTYLAESLFNLVSVKSNYTSRGVKLPPGRMHTEIVLTENDRDLFLSYIPRIAAIVFEPISVLAQNVDDGLFYSLTDDSSGSANITYNFQYNNGIDIYDLDQTTVIGQTAGFDLNQLRVMDAYVQSALVYGFLWLWYTECQLFELAAFNKNQMEEELKNIRTAILYRKPAGRTSIPHRTL